MKIFFKILVTIPVVPILLVSAAMYRIGQFVLEVFLDLYFSFWSRIIDD